MLILLKLRIKFTHAFFAVGEVMKKDFSHAMQELQKEEGQDKVAIFEWVNILSLH